MLAAAFSLSGKASAGLGTTYVVEKTSLQLLNTQNP
jgi:hypothetical protein